MGIRETIKIYGKTFPDGFMVWWKKASLASRYFVHVKLDKFNILTKEIDRGTSFFVLSPLPELKFDVYVEAENAKGVIFAKSAIMTLEVSQSRRTSGGYVKHSVDLL